MGAVGVSGAASAAQDDEIASAAAMVALRGEANPIAIFTASFILFIC